MAPATVEAVRLYSVAAVADRLQVSENWVRKQITEHKLRAVELGSTRAKTRVRADDLQAFIDSRTFGTEGAA